MSSKHWPNKFLAVASILAVLLPWGSGTLYAASGLCTCDYTVDGKQTCKQMTAEDSTKCAQYCESTGGASADPHFEGDPGSDRAQELITACSKASNPCYPLTCSTSTTTTTTPTTRPFQAPILAVPIPDLKFTDVAMTSGGEISVNYIAEYVNAMYRYLVNLSVLIATAILMLSGIIYILGSYSGNVGPAKERIKNATTGFVLLLSLTVTLYLVNPQLTVFHPLNLLLIPPLPADYESEEDVVTGTVATSFGTPEGRNITGAGKTKVPSDLVSAIEAVATTLNGQGFGMVISSSYRTVEDQKRLIHQHCQNPPGSATCNPKPGHQVACILKDNNAANCPHTTGRALDIFGSVNGNAVISAANCIKDLNACRALPAQKALIEAMRAQGFCVLDSEPWHFEKPKMSSRCN